MKNRASLVSGSRASLVSGSVVVVKSLTLYGGACE